MSGCAVRYNVVRLMLSDMFSDVVLSGIICQVMFSDILFSDIVLPDTMLSDIILSSIMSGINSACIMSAGNVVR